MSSPAPIPWQEQPPDAELAAREHEAALTAQVRNATIAECQRWLRESAKTATYAAWIFEPKYRQPFFDRAAGYRSAADLLEALRS
ncbi:MAG TPA: hypothetical protein VJ140_10210 [Actinomycetota bacterium]|nr:hypothetical protein [Actinomycetota bacterium]